jgi:hypothetical protein
MELCKYGWILRDKKRRLTYKKCELRKLILKTLLYSTEYNYNYKIYFVKKFYSFSKNSSISIYRTYGMFSYIGKSVFKRFKLNRHAAKYNASLGFLVGLRKSSF